MVHTVWWSLLVSENNQSDKNPTPNPRVRAAGYLIQMISRFRSWRYKFGAAYVFACRTCQFQVWCNGYGLLQFVFLFWRVQCAWKLRARS